MNFRKLLLTWALSLIFTALSFTALYVNKVEIVNGVRFIDFGILYSFFAVNFCAYVIYSFAHLLGVHNGSDSKKEKSQIKVVLWGLVLAYSVGSIFSLLLPVFFHYSRTEFIGPIGPLILVVFLAYAITKYEVMDIRVIISRSTAWVLTVILLGSVYGALVWAYRTFRVNRIDLLLFSWTILYGIFVGEVFHRIRLFIQTTSDKIFLRGKYDYYKSLSEVSGKITEHLSMENISGILNQTFHDIIEASNPRVYLADDFEKPQVKPLLAINKISFKDGELIAPCRVEGRPIAIIVLGKKLSEDPYTEEDMRLLSALASQTAIAIDHTRTYEAVKKDYEANQQKLVDTERMLARSEKIASLANLIREYNHEIKTPLSIIRGETALLVKELRDPKYLEWFKNLVFEQVDRANDIVESTLRLSTPKERKEVPLDLNLVIESALKVFPLSGIHLEKELSAIPGILGDEEDLKMSFVNLLKNAAEAMPHGGQITIRSYVQKDDSDFPVRVEISDTGVGIPPENLERIFEPFFSTHVTKGRGLGLSIVFRIVREHLGQIEVKSRLGKGTMFILKFPVKS